MQLVFEICAPESEKNVPLDRKVFDVSGGVIGGGSEEIMKDLAARQLGI